MARQRQPIGLPLAPAPEPEVLLYAGDMAEDLRIVSRNRLAEAITGGLSYPSKMPCPAWGISATRCRVGSVLARQPGTVCHECYATRGTYGFQSVQRKLEERYQGLFHPLWVPAMVFLVNYFCDRYFRLFDSGGLVSQDHYRNIITLARHTPDVLTWMPTRESQTIQSVHRDLLRRGLTLPRNLIVRVSANHIDGEPPNGLPHTSTVVTDTDEATCIAHRQKNRCDGEVANCRACWADPHVSYPLR